MQLILQATHGIVSGAPGYFKRAFGDTAEDFERLLIKPHKYIFNRVWYEELEGAAELEEFESEFKNLSNGDQADLLQALVSFESNSFYEIARATISNPQVARIFRFYAPLSHNDEVAIWNRQKSLQSLDAIQEVLVPVDQRVEDAGLEIEPVLESL